MGRRIALEVCPWAFSRANMWLRVLHSSCWGSTENKCPCKNHSPRPPRLPIGKPLIHSFSPKRGTCSSVARAAIRFKLSGVFLNPVTLGTVSSQKRNSALFYIFVSSSQVCRRNIWKPEAGRLKVKESVRTRALFEAWDYWFFNISLQAWEAWVMVLEHVATLSPWPPHRISFRHT